MVLSLRLLFPWLQLEVFDAHRLGLKPIRRRVWALCGKTPLAQERPHCRGLYVHAFVRPGTGKAGTGCCPPAFNLRQVRLAGTPPGGVGLVFCPLLAWAAARSWSMALERREACCAYLPTQPALIQRYTLFLDLRGAEDPR